MNKRIAIGLIYYDDKKSADIPQKCTDAINAGIDAIMFCDMSEGDEGHDKCMDMIRTCARISEVPIISGGRIHRLEDVKKYLYAGSAKVYFEDTDAGEMSVYKEAVERFGAEKLILKSKIYIGHNNYEDISSHLKDSEYEYAVFVDNGKLDINYYDFKNKLSADGIPVDIMKPAFAWSDIKLDSTGLLPVVVQDYRTSEVLMVAYMNEEAYNRTIEYGRMTYWSRSRNELWIKGDTSGHYQYVKSLTLDCDNDTLLAKVFQVGSACHTGKGSCFFNTVIKKELSDRNPHKVLEDVYSVIVDRKNHPKEGSYTNYLFDKGLDKILKKVGEEATEVVIAAKNPDPEEIKYEISDFLYHAMVLMVLKGVTWDDIMNELADR